jgi:hypothetical protein
VCGDNYRLYLCSGLVTNEVIHLRRAWFVGHSFAAASAHILIAVTPPAPAAQKFTVGLPEAEIKKIKTTRQM